jgi:hypothetical protein
LIFNIAVFLTDYSEQGTEQADLSVGSIPFSKIQNPKSKIQNPKSIDLVQRKFNFE